MKIPKPYKRSEAPEAPFYFQFSVGGKRYQWCSDTNDENTALSLAMKQIAEMRLGVAVRAPGGIASIQEVVDAYRANSPHLDPKTVEGNVNKLRTILEVSGLTFAAPVAALTRQVLVKYQASKAACPTSANSVARQARSIFSRRAMVNYDHLSLPSIDGFMRHPLLREPRKSYTPPPSGVIASVVEAAKGLKLAEPAAYCAFLLEMYAGLRAGEAVGARWDWVRDNGASAWIEVPPTFKSKANRIINLDVAALAELKELKACEYLIPVENEWARHKVVHRVLGPWLRPLLGAGRKTNHELRKLFGSAVARADGLFAAQKALGHSSPKLTSDYYAGVLSLPSAVSAASFA